MVENCGQMKILAYSYTVLRCEKGCLSITSTIHCHVLCLGQNCYPFGKHLYRQPISDLVYLRFDGQGSRSQGFLESEIDNIFVEDILSFMKRYVPGEFYVKKLGSDINNIFHSFHDIFVQKVDSLPIKDRGVC